MHACQKYREVFANEPYPLSRSGSPSWQLSKQFMRVYLEFKFHLNLYMSIVTGREMKILRHLRKRWTLHGISGQNGKFTTSWERMAISRRARRIVIHIHEFYPDRHCRGKIPALMISRSWALSAKRSTFLRIVFFLRFGAADKQAEAQLPE